MNVPCWLWLATIGVLIAIIVIDLLVVDSRPHAFSTREAGICTFCLPMACALRMRVNMSAIGSVMLMTNT